MSDKVAYFCGHIVSPSELQLITECVRRYPKLSREELANTVCEWLDWCRPNGHLKARECRTLLQHLHERSIIELPALRAAGRPRGSQTRIPHTPQNDASQRFEGKLSDAQPINIKRVERKDEHDLWRELVGRHHYLGYRTPYGASLRYLIQSAQPQVPTTLGCLQFSSPAWSMKARDEWIGWSDATRRQGLPRLINNSRFLILPWIRIPNLASHVLALALKAVVHDWAMLYGLEPWLAETLVDGSRFTGGCYRAANWKDIGETTGRGRQDKDHRHELSKKRILLYPLRHDARSRLLAE